MGEFLSNIKFLKMYAWEEPMCDLIRVVRKTEKVRNLVDYHPKTQIAVCHGSECAVQTPCVIHSSMW